MASSKRPSNGDKKEGLLEAVIGLGLTVLVLGGFVWFVASHKIVYYFTPFLRWMGAPWAFFNKERWAAINEGYVFFRNSPRQVPLGNFVEFTNACLKPLSLIVCLTIAGYLVYRLLFKKSGGSLRRQLAPMEVAHEIAKTFPAVVPVLHLGPDLVKDRLPLWRRQTFPEDIWMKEKVLGKGLVNHGKLVTERVSTYFRGGEVKDGPHQKRSGRRWSRMLGFLVVDLPVDVGHHEKICFADRFSPAGKVLFALLCAHAFGGREGKNDYRKAAAQINRTSAGQKNGIPNLTVAQWLYTKYRMNSDARKLFQVHHWEYTYLMSLFMKAKRNGKATHTDFIWLKPMDRIMFYVLNTVGRATPHAESSGAFSQFDFELKAAKFGRLPLRFRPDGVLEATIAVYTAVEGLDLEFTRFTSGTDDNDDWWKELGVWSAAERMAAARASMKQEIDDIEKSNSQITNLPVQPDTAADVAVREQIKKEENLAMARAVAAANGFDLDLV